MTKKKMDIDEVYNGLLRKKSELSRSHGDARGEGGGLAIKGAFERGESVRVAKSFKWSGEVKKVGDTFQAPGEELLARCLTMAGNGYLLTESAWRRSEELKQVKSLYERVLPLHDALMSARASKGKAEGKLVQAQAQVESAILKANESASLVIALEEELEKVLS